MKKVVESADALSVAEVRCGLEHTHKKKNLTGSRWRTLMKRRRSEGYFGRGEDGTRKRDAKCPASPFLFGRGWAWFNSTQEEESDGGNDR